ncbi:MAG: NYN domain-containing protein [Candidatus Tantalella remota]|nr:NYN domain-containing protein [Candidatus Tantalella remota]
MITTLVIDGYNAINAIPEARKKINESLLSARSAIIIIAKEFVRSSGYINDFCVVFDGQNKYRNLERMHIPVGGVQVFSESGEGDDTIIDTVRKYANEGRVIVASNDNYVKNMSRGYGASLMSVDDLVRRKGKDSWKKSEGDEKKRIGRRDQNKITKDYMKELGLE